MNVVRASLSLANTSIIELNKRVIVCSNSLRVKMTTTRGLTYKEHGENVNNCERRRRRLMQTSC